MSLTANQSARRGSDVASRYEAVIGLEVHAQLLTQTKAFCGCSRKFGDPPNTNTCPVCLGLPGALPVLNRKALELGSRASLAINCEIQARSRFARKNYFYPDLSKGYQISMYELPLATGGWLEIEIGGERKRIGITRLHLEEDAAKGMHEGFADSDRYSYIDFNRCGVPLIEIVSEPDLRSPAEAYAYLTALKQILEFTEVSDCNMESGSLRCDANVSVRLRGADKFGTKAEVKNLNSFRFLQRALEYEIERQIGVVESGQRVSQETRLYNVGAGRTESMRSKEFAHDYRYFPDPDLLPVSIDSRLVDEVRKGMPELPESRRRRFADEMGISAYDAGVLTATRELADYFEATVRVGATPKSAANWIGTEFLRRLKEANQEIQDSKVSPANLAHLLGKIESNELPVAVAKKAFVRMFETGQAADEIIAAEGLAKRSDTAEVERVARAVVAENAANVAKYRAGNEGVSKFFVGQVMRQTRGQADPQTVNEVVKRVLSES